MRHTGGFNDSKLEVGHPWGFRVHGGIRNGFGDQSLQPTRPCTVIPDVTALLSSAANDLRRGGQSAARPHDQRRVRRVSKGRTRGAAGGDRGGAETAGSLSRRGRAVLGLAGGREAGRNGEARLGRGRRALRSGARDGQGRKGGAARCDRGESRGSGQTRGGHRRPAEGGV